MITAGIDAGSRAVKIALVDTVSGELAGTACADQKVKSEVIAHELFNELLAKQKLHRKDISGIVATGYSRNLIHFADSTVTEITCHAKGVRQLMPEARSVVEIGGQDSKLLHLNPDGSVRDFAMNDRCAAGTGRFLEIVADKLEIPLDRLGEYAERSKSPATISSMCVVFAETEIISLLSSGTACEDIVAGVQTAITSRIAAMAAGRLAEPVVFTGGVALVSGMDRSLTKVVKKQVVTAPHPQFTGAIGAALMAAKPEPSPKPNN